MNTTDQSNDETPQSASVQIKINHAVILTDMDASLIDQMSDLAYISEVRDEVRDWFLAYIKHTQFSDRSRELYGDVDAFFSRVNWVVTKYQLAQKGGEANV